MNILHRAKFNNYVCILLFRRSLQSGEVSLDLRLANITPIFKKGDHSTTPSNYRPISLTSAC